MEIDKADGSKTNMEKTAKLESVPLPLFKDGGNIPEWLLTEILLKLPFKIVFKFKIVSKQWLAVISHPSFARTYVSQASSQSWTLISDIICPEGSGINISDLNLKLPRVCVLRPPLTQQSRYYVYGVDNGLVLCAPIMLEFSVSQYYKPSYSICNPITHEWITLPPHLRRFDKPITGFLTYVGDNNVLASFKVVRLEATAIGIIRFEVFVSEIWEWKEFKIRLYGQKIEFISSKTPAALNGNLHWLTERHGLLALDTNTFLKRLIPVPTDIAQDDGGDGHKISALPGLCEVHQGRLRYCNVFEKDGPLCRFGVWICNDYESGVWCLQHKVSSANIRPDAILDSFFNPFDPEVVYFCYKGALVSFNMKTKSLETKGARFGWLFVIPHTLVPFVIPPRPVSVSSRQFTVG